MRFLYGFIAVVMWGFAITYIVSKGTVMPSADVQFITLAIVFAGALAGGD